MTSVFDEDTATRRMLGRRLRALREATGESGNAFATRVGLSQSQVSRVERGERVPSADDLVAWLDLVSPEDDMGIREELRFLRERAATEAASWHARRRRVSSIQDDVVAAEAAAGLLRTWHPTLIPGLMQTPAYAEAMFRLHMPEQVFDVAEAVAHRMNRQSLLYRPGHRFELIFGEAAIRYQPISRLEMAGQLDRIRQVAGLPHVTVGMLPFGPIKVWYAHGFDVFDERAGGEGPLVHVERLVGWTNLRDPDDVASYVAAFEAVRDASLRGAALETRLAQVAAELTG